MNNRRDDVELVADRRPNPDELLARVQADEAKVRRGKLRIFFGYAAGVGKTFAMLEAAQRERGNGVDVAVGYVEPHGRPETESLLEGLERLPTRSLDHRGTHLREFDLDAALARKPALILVDEMAHTNADGCRHAKRWQDIQELLDAGIDVWTTLNVQHIESLNDVIAQVTGVTVRETLPDSVIEQAGDLELIDITPDELIERLHAGKVYVPAQAERAIRNFFQKPNLSALRELSLRQAASRIGREVEIARRQQAPQRTWATAERLMVCVGPSPTTARLLRSAKRMAAAFGCEWLAVSVEPPGGRVSRAMRERIDRHLQLAERLGAEPVGLVGDKVGQTIVDFARKRNVTKIIVGKTAQPWWRRLLRNTVVDELLESSGDIDVYVIRGERELEKPTSESGAPRRNTEWQVYARTAVVVGICWLSGLGMLWLGLAEANIVMVFLLGVAFVAARYGRGPAVAASISSVLVFDFFFVPPRLTLAFADSQYALTFGVMLVIGLVISTLSVRLRDQVNAAIDRERRTAALHRLSRQLAALAGSDFIVAHASKQLAELFDAEVAIFLREPNGSLSLRHGERTQIATHPQSLAVAQWVLDHEQLAGSGTDTLPDNPALFAPISSSERTIGVVALRPSEVDGLRSPPQQQLLESCAGQIALALERDNLAIEAQEARLRVESEQLRNALLSSVSHDLRTPLAVIAGAASSLIEAPQSESTRRELLQTMVDESHRMARLVDNLLDMTRLESGAIELNRQWHVLEELVGSALGRLRRQLAEHSVHVDIPADLPLVSVDGLLFEQVLVNLFENAARHTPPKSRIELSARSDAPNVIIRLIDDGLGLPAGHESRVFDKFFRGSAITTDSRRGVGLGLAICRAIVLAHGGEIAAANRPSGGAEFTIRLVSPENSPTVRTESSENAVASSQGVASS
jgi:two-component system sensor histidine kinase KdpD